jgi:hypothetical protein
MPATNPRINITLESETLKLLARISAEENKSLSSLSKELITEALELREDAALYTIAEKRDTKKAKRITHENAWK